MNMYPPWWGFPPPPPNGSDKGPSRKDIERAVRMAFQMRDAPKKDKRKRKEERQKKAAVLRAKFFTFIEIFILGVVLHPVVGILYDHLITYLQRK